MVLVAKPMFSGIGNHLGQFPEASDRHEGQELDCEADMGNHLEPFSGRSEASENGLKRFPIPQNIGFAIRSSEI